MPHSPRRAWLSKEALLTVVAIVLSVIGALLLLLMMLLPLFYL